MAQNCKFYKEKKQVSYDNGVTFVDVVPAEYRKGELIERASPDCGYVDYSNQYLTFEAISAGTFSFSGTSSSTINNSSIQYSLDSGSTWYTLNREVQSPTVSAGQKIMWKGSLTPNTNSGNYGIGRFYSTNSFNIEGNAMSLLYGDNFDGQTSLSGKNDVFVHLFRGCTDLISAENLVLPATTLSSTCYWGMFFGCTSLTTAPELPAATLVGRCYGEMFEGCTSLSYVKCLATDISATNCTYAWLSSVSSSGTFVKASTMSSWESGASGIPSNWTVQNA